MGNVLRIENKLAQLNSFFASRDSIIGVLIFGSYNTPYYNENSDIDFGVIYEEHKNVGLLEQIQIEDSISNILSKDDIDLVNLNNAPLAFQHKVISTGKIIYEKDYIKVSDFIERIYNRFCNYEYYYRMLCKEYEDSLREEYLNA